MPARNYSMNIIANKSFYNHKNKSYDYSPGSSGFFIETRPNLTAYGTTASGFWNGNTSISGILDVWVGMDEIAFPGLKIYPNPATDVVYLEIQETVTATLSDVLGKIIFRNEFSSGHHQINVGDLKPGAYVLCISANGKIAHRTIIKQ